jgi:hypothetical protein
MARTITVDFPYLGEMGTIEILGLGVFTNGEHEVTDEQEGTFEALGQKWPDDNFFGYVETPSVVENEEPAFDLRVVERDPELFDDDDIVDDDTDGGDE